MDQGWCQAKVGEVDVFDFSVPNIEPDLTVLCYPPQQSLSQEIVD